MIQIPDELRMALESDDGESLSEIVERKRPRDFDALRELLSLDPSIPPQYRTKALAALGRWGDPAIVPTIRDLLPELSERERISAIDALGWVGTREALTVVSEYTSDPSPQVRKFVAMALRRIDTREARSALKKMAAEDPEDWVRAVASKRRSRRT